MKNEELERRIEKLERERTEMVRSLRLVASEGAKDVATQREEGEYVIIGRMMGAARYALSFANEAAS